MTGVLTPPYPEQSIPDVSAGLLAFNSAWEEAKRAGHVAVCIQLRRGRWIVKLDVLTVPGHKVGEADAAVLAEAVRTAVIAGIATTGTIGPVMYGLEGLVGRRRRGPGRPRCTPPSTERPQPCRLWPPNGPTGATDHAV
jgi:hypothetical protein